MYVCVKERECVCVRVALKSRLTRTLLVVSLKHASVGKITVDKTEWIEFLIHMDVLKTSLVEKVVPYILTKQEALDLFLELKRKTVPASHLLPRPVLPIPVLPILTIAQPLCVTQPCNDM